MLGIHFLPCFTKLVRITAMLNGSGKSDHSCLTLSLINHSDFIIRCHIHPSNLANTLYLYEDGPSIPYFLIVFKYKAEVS